MITTIKLENVSDEEVDRMIDGLKPVMKKFGVYVYKNPLFIMTDESKEPILFSDNSKLTVGDYRNSITSRSLDEYIVTLMEDTGVHNSNLLQVFIDRLDVYSNECGFN